MLAPRLTTSLLLLATSAFPVVNAAPKLFICSDSTTANYTVPGALQGWGYYIGEYLKIPVSNQARNGRSTRSFIREGLWDKLLANVTKGDFVVIEMGHNDDGDPLANNTYAERATLPGIGEDTVTGVTLAGVEEVVHSFGWYLRKMIVDVNAKGGVPLLSGMVNRNYWTGEVLQSDWPFATYAREVAIAQGVEYIAHTEKSDKKFQSFGSVLAKTYFPNDNTHTNAAGAIINAETFVSAVKCGKSTTKFERSHLLKYLNAKGKNVTESS